MLGGDNVDMAYLLVPVEAVTCRLLIHSRGSLGTLKGQQLSFMVAL